MCRGLKGFPFSCNSCSSRSHFSTICPKSPKPFVGKTSILAKRDECILPVIIISFKRHGRPIYLKCIVDTGSQSSFFSGTILDKFRSRENLSPNSVNTFIGTKSVNLTELGVSVKSGSQKPFIFAALFTDSLKLKFEVSRFDEVVNDIKRAGFRLDPGYEKINNTTLDDLIGLDLPQRLEKFQLIECLNGSAWQTAKGIIPFRDVSCFVKSNAKVKRNPYKYLSFADTIRVLPQCSNYLIESVMNPVHSYPNPLDPFFEDSLVERGIENFLSLDSIGIDCDNDSSSYDDDKINELKKISS